MDEITSSPNELITTTSPSHRFRPPRLVRLIGAPILGGIVGLLLGAVLIMLAGADPLAAYQTMLAGAFGGPRQLTETTLKVGPLLLMGLGLTIAFRCKVWNIGGEGQYFMGALAGAGIGLLLQDSLPAVVLIPLMLLAGVLGGALWAGIAAFLKLRFGLNEIITTLMLNYIAEFTLLYLAREPLKDPDSFLPQSAQLVGAARMPTLFDSRIHIGVLLALLLVPAVYVLLWQTPLGFRLRAIGSSQSVSRYAGMNVALGLSLALLLSGAFAGLAGVIEVSALHTRLKDGISGNYGFTGILVALLGRLHPVGVVFAAIFFAALSIGAQTMHSVYGLPIALAQVIQGLVVLFVLAADALARRIWR
ncbi:MAG: ABC transporter permease [Anaerolineae bacterium]|nr:ABC transporter permease [Anaerolineae bacterium]